MNSNKDGWVGGNVTIFSEGELGRYPYIATNGTVLNGGVPQVNKNNYNQLTFMAIQLPFHLKYITIDTFS